MAKQQNQEGRLKKLLIVWVLLAAVMATAITVTGVSIISAQIRKDREQTVIGAARLAAQEINAARVDEWLENGKDDEYAQTFESLKDVLENTPYLKYLYVYQIKEDGCHVVFDTDPAEPGNLGDVQEFDESFMPLLPDLLAGKPIDIMESNDSFGWLLTKYEPIYNSKPIFLEVLARCLRKTPYNLLVPDYNLELF